MPIHTSRNWRSIALTSLLAIVLALAVASHAAAQAPQLDHDVLAMAGNIDKARTEAHLRPLAVSGSLTRAAQRYAQYMVGHDRWAHARHIKVRGFHRVGEILGMAPGDVGIGQVVDAWLHSPVHRQIMLDGAFRYFGVGTASGQFQGKRTTVWVVRLGC